MTPTNREMVQIFFFFQNRFRRKTLENSSFDDGFVPFSETSIDLDASPKERLELAVSVMNDPTFREVEIIVRVMSQSNLVSYKRPYNDRFYTSSRGDFAQGELGLGLFPQP
ncbi:unnamed protein product [Eruca vesicaria subsp. sativa]|uniref:Uncharacterized protein n=1 Tax=Eruca vesicaria subsp. sativa TaxID=29727 RepID=A0ABC8JUJ1_ERUVS|nr:unnamed protein product [Eruca vesicaria subsp. sativa]